MSDASFQIGQRVADRLKFTYKTESTLTGDKRRVRWHPKPGTRKMQAGEFWPEVDATPVQLTISLGTSRVTLYIRGTVRDIIIDAVGVSGDVHPNIMDALKNAGVPDIVTEVKGKVQWFRENPQYVPKPGKPAKSKLNPDQLEVSQAG